MRARSCFLVVGLVVLAVGGARAETKIQAYAVPGGAGPHDVAPAPDGTVWYTAQSQGALGRLDPKTGHAEQIKLGADSAPHGVIIGPDGAPWVTDGGLNAIVRVDPETSKVAVYKLPARDSYANLNTASFDKRGRLWFTGQNGYYGVLEPKSGEVRLFDAPKGTGPYGITTTPAGAVFYASLAGSYLGHIDLDSAKVEVIVPPTPNQGARRAWSDKEGGVWISEWNAGRIARFDSASGGWRTWQVPGGDAQPYAIYVDETGKVWLSDFGANALWRFDPGSEKFEKYPLPHRHGSVRQLAGRAGEVWGAESSADHLVVVRFQ
jgi:virginiamycin B lyase